MLNLNMYNILQDQWKVFFLLVSSVKGSRKSGCLQKHLEFTGEDVELVPRDVDASNDDVVEHGFHEDVDHTDILQFWRRLGDVDDVVKFGFFVSDGFAVEAGVFRVILVVNWNKD
jgi:hypothetical protein